ncbi:MAG TPA: type II toxin-antitoxin system PemK/MazF family toxin [Verrucomicrobiae bacterium]|nr:type II toxin-antitoxin system PemK/MazF family toxin [Verrucomicrobiae bacterium]
MKLPRRGEIWLCDLGMAAKVRPVLILSVPFGDHDYALFHVVPHTTAVRDSQFEVAAVIPFLERGVFNIQGSQSIPRANLLRQLGTLTGVQLAQVEESFRRWLQL